MATWKDVARVVAALPETTEAPPRTWRVRKKLIVWERPLRKADWSAIARDCVNLLARSKDLQLAAWLQDAWARQRHIEGFNAGTDLLMGLVERHWDNLHPLIEGNDSEARVAAFIWINENMPLVLRVRDGPPTEKLSCAPPKIL